MCLRADWLLWHLRSNTSLFETFFILGTELPPQSLELHMVGGQDGVQNSEKYRQQKMYLVFGWPPLHHQRVVRREAVSVILWEVKSCVKKTAR